MPTVETTILEDHQAILVVTVEPERVEKEKRAAAKRIAKHVNIPGFRRGKAPYNVILRHYGDGVILEEALDPLGQTVYVEALEESDIQPYAPGELTDLAMDPLIMTFTVPLVPDVDLAEYRDIRIEYTGASVSEDEISSALEELREQQATLDPVERPIAVGDVAMLDIVGTWVRESDDTPESPDDETESEHDDVWLNRKAVRVKISDDATYPVPGFPLKTVGMSANEELSFVLSFDDNDEDVSQTLRGKTLEFTVRCDEVYEYNAPELDDDLAKELDEKYESLDDLKADVTEQLLHNAEHMVRDEYLNEIFTKLIDEVVKVSYPPIMVDDQIDRMLEDFNSTLQQQGMTLEEYMRIRNIDEDEVRSDFYDEAVNQLKRALILSNLAEAENLSVTDDDIDDHINTAILTFGTQSALAKQLFSTPEAKRSIANQLLAEKSIDRLILIARNEAPEVGAEAAPDVTPETDMNGDSGIADTPPPPEELPNGIASDLEIKEDES